MSLLGAERIASPTSGRRNNQVDTVCAKFARSIQRESTHLFSQGFWLTSGDSRVRGAAASGHRATAR